ncbi:MAG: hypothetical protein RJB58_1074 [Pseudomonadota bacterium]|jgi:UrcA family protein
MLRNLSTTALFVLAVTTAQAAEVTPVDVASINVTYGDLNLSKSQDAAILADRLQAVGARSLCQDQRRLAVRP